MGAHPLCVGANPAAEPIPGSSIIQSGRTRLTMIWEEGRLGFRERIGHDPLGQSDRRAPVAFDGRSWRSGMM